MKRLLGALACALGLAGCASDPYYGYGSYGYGYGYDYATPYYYDYGYPYYGYPSFGGGLSLHYYDYDRSNGRWHDRGRWRDHDRRDHDRRDHDRGRGGRDRDNNDRPPSGNLGRSAPSDYGGTRGGPVMADPVPPGQRMDAAGR